MNFLFYLNLKNVILTSLLTLTLLVNCVSAQSLRSPAGRGGMHSGGGNLYKGKPLEAYMKPIKEMESYKEFVAPILEEIQRSGSHKLYNFLNYTLENKNWFFVPGPLEGIPKEVVGLAIKTEQGVLQSFDNLIIDNDLWENPKMTKKDQALLIIHELWMGMKIAQFGSQQLQCQQSDGTNYQYSCIGNNNADFNEIKLTPVDYKQVQKLTQITFSKYQSFKKEDWLKIVNENNFEFQWNFFEKENYKKMDWNYFSQNLKMGIYTNNNPKYGLDMQKSDQISREEAKNIDNFSKYITRESCEVILEENLNQINLKIKSPTFNYDVLIERSDEISFRKENITDKSRFLMGFIGHQFDRFNLGRKIKSLNTNIPDKYMNIIMLTDYSGIAYLSVQEMTCTVPGDSCQNIDVKGGLSYVCSRIKNPLGIADFN